jgi:hypothetical protein
VSPVRAAWLVALLLPSLAVARVPGNPNDLPSLPPDEAAKCLEDFRSSGLPVDLVARFTLTHKPRSGADRRTEGTLWMSWRHAGPAARVDVPGRSFLVLRTQAGTRLWSADAGKPAVPMGGTGMGPLVEGFLFSPYDLQAPFADWTDTRYERSERRRGRPLNLYLARHPDGASGTPPAVRFGLDRAYLALIEASTLDAEGKVTRLMLAEDFAQVDGTWILGRASVRDERSRDRDVLEVTSACVNARLPAATFDPGLLGAPPAAPQGDFRKL